MSCIPIQDFSLISLCDATKAGKLYSIVPDSGAGDFDVTRASTATYLGSDGLIKTAANDEPRIEFNPDGSYKGLLVEPSATNLVLRSEEFDDAYWPKVNATITANATTAPDGTMTADLITVTATNGYLSPTNTGIFSAAGGTARAYSLFLKAGTSTSVRLQISTANVNQSYFGLFDLVLGTAVPTTANTNVFIQNYGNGWYRCTVSANIASATYSELQIGRVANGLNFYAWGAQLETGSVATSYIPTVASTVTRAGDVITRTGASALIGQTEGTLYCEFEFDGINQLRILLRFQTSDGSLDFAFREPNDTVAQKFHIRIATSLGANYNLFNNIDLNVGINKLAFKYTKTNNILSGELFVNGQSKGTNSGLNFAANFENIFLSLVPLSYSGHIKAVAILPTAISEQAAINLTS